MASKSDHEEEECNGYDSEEEWHNRRMDRQSRCNLCDRHYSFKRKPEIMPCCEEMICLPCLSKSENSDLSDDLPKCPLCHESYLDDEEDEDDDLFNGAFKLMKKVAKNSKQAVTKIKSTHILKGHTGDVCGLAHLKDDLLASGSRDRSIRIWDISSGKEARVIRGSSKGIFSLLGLSDGSTIASGAINGEIKLWNAETGHCTSTLEGHTNIVTSLICLPQNGQLVSGSLDGDIRTWDVASGSCVDRIEKAHESIQSPLQVLPNGDVKSSGEKNVKVWHHDTHKLVIQRMTDFEKKIEGQMLILPNNNRILVGVGGGGIAEMNFKDKTFENILMGHKKGIQSLKILSDGSLASSSDDKDVRIWNLKTHKCKHVCKGHQDSVYAVEEMPNGDIVSGSADTSVRVWRINKRKFGQNISNKY